MAKSKRLEDFFNNTSNNNSETECLEYIQNEMPFDDTIDLATLDKAYERFPDNKEIIVALINRVDLNSELPTKNLTSLYAAKNIASNSLLPYPRLVSTKNTNTVNNAKKIADLLGFFELKSKMQKQKVPLDQTENHVLESSKYIQKEIEKSTKKLEELTGWKTELEEKEKANLNQVILKKVQENIELANQSIIKKGEELKKLEKDLYRAQFFELKKELLTQKKAYFEQNNTKLQKDIAILQSTSRNLLKKQEDLDAQATRGTGLRGSKPIFSVSVFDQPSLYKISSQLETNQEQSETAASSLTKLEERVAPLEELIKNCDRQIQALKEGPAVKESEGLEGVELTHISSIPLNPHKQNSFQTPVRPKYPNNQPLNRANTEDIDVVPRSFVTISTTHHNDVEQLNDNNLEVGDNNASLPSLHPPVLNPGSIGQNPTFAPPVADDEFKIKLVGHQMLDRLRFIHPNDNLNSPQEGYVDETYTAGKGFKYKVMQRDGDSADKEYKINVPIKDKDGNIVKGKFDTIILDVNGYLIKKNMAQNLSPGEHSQVDTEWLNSLKFSQKVREQNAQQGQNPGKVASSGAEIKVEEGKSQELRDGLFKDPVAVKNRADEKESLNQVVEKVEQSPKIRGEVKKKVRFESIDVENHTDEDNKSIHKPEAILEEVQNHNRLQFESIASSKNSAFNQKKDMRVTLEKTNKFSTLNVVPSASREETHNKGGTRR